MNEMSGTLNKALELTAQINLHISAVNSHLLDMCQCIRTVKDENLYRELGYTTLESYAECEFGFKRRQTFKFVKIAQAFSTEIVQSTAQLQSLGTEKLYMLAVLEPDERDEIIETVDVENATVKALKSQIDELKRQNDEFAEKQKKEQTHIPDYETLEMLYDANLRRTTEIQDERDRLKSELEELKKNPASKAEDLQEINRLQAEIEQLARRPVEVAVEDNSAETDRLTAEINDLRNRLKQAECTDAETSRNKEISSAIDAYLETIDDVMLSIETQLEHTCGDTKLYLCRKIRSKLECWQNKFYM